MKLDIPIRLLLICGLSLAAIPAAHACGIDMRDYIQLRAGMSEGEVLQRIGIPDHETVVHGHFGAITERTWYYLPGNCGVDNLRWITEITLDGRGKIKALERYRP